MTDILDLPNWRYIDKRQDELGHELHVEYTIDPDFCLKCGVVGNLYKHGFTNTTYLDCPMWGRPARLLVKVRRYKCRDCTSTFLQPLAGIDAGRRMTLRALAYIQQQSLRDTFQRVSEHLGCDEKTVRNVANEFIEFKDDDYKPYLPEWIGLDETHLNKVMRAIITDVGARKPVDMLPDREKPTLRRWFGQFRDRSHVKGLAIDMWAPYRDVAGELFENLPVVVDKFHVVKKANESVEKARVRLGKTQDAKVRRSWMRSKALLRMRYRDLNDKQRFNLDMWLDNEPEMAAAYRLKERLFDIYDKPKAEAIADYDSFAGDVPANLKSDFHELTRAMKNWRKEILNYFDYPITNAYTEGLNGVAKVMSRMGRGYSFEVIRARVLFNDRKPSPRQLRAQRAAVKDVLYRCACCYGLFKGAEMDAEGLPPLAKTPYLIEHFHDDGSVTCGDGYTADQVRQAQRDAVAADRSDRTNGQFVLMPKQPTTAMCNAAREEALSWENSSEPWSLMTWFRIYKAMRRSAPARAQGENT